MSAAFSPDGSHVVTTSEDDTTRVWNADGSGEPIVFGEHENDEPSILRRSGPVLRATFSPDGQRIITASSDGTARVWNADGSGKPVVLSGHKAQITIALFSLDGSLILTAFLDGTAQVWKADGSTHTTLIAGEDDLLGDAAFSPDGSRVLIASLNGIRVWNSDGSGKPIVLWEPVVRLEQQIGVMRESTLKAAFSPDGSRVLIATYNGIVGIFNADGSGEPLFLRGHQGPVDSAAFSPDGSLVVTASRDHTARVWDASGSGEPVILSGTAPVTSATFSSDGSRVAVGYLDGAARVWKADRSAEPITLRGHKGSVLSAAFSPEGKTHRHHR